MKLRTIAGDVLRATIIYGLTAFASAHDHSQSSLFDPIATAAADTIPDDPLLVAAARDPRGQTESFDAACDQTFQRDGVVQYYAQHVFAIPRSAQDLAGTRVLGRIVHEGLPGYSLELLTKGIFVRDGAVAVECGNETTGRTFDHVTFITPRRYKLDIDNTNPWPGDQQPSK